MLSTEPSFDEKGTIVAESFFPFPIYAVISGSYDILYSVFSHSPFPDNGRMMVFESYSW